MAELVPSLAKTVRPPAVPLGTVKEQLKLPLESDVQGLGVVVWLLPLKLTVILWLAMKPVPATVTLVPTGPGLGLKVIARVTVNVTGAEFVPSLAVTVRPPAGALGTVKEQLKLPVEPEVQELGVVVTLLPANWMVMEWDAVKPVPVTVTELPTAPEDGVRPVAALTV